MASEYLTYHASRIRTERKPTHLHSVPLYVPPPEPPKPVKRNWWNEPISFEAAVIGLIVSVAFLAVLFLAPVVEGWVQ